MSCPIEFQGLRALEYAAQTGAQLRWRRRNAEAEEPISASVALALWSLGAEAQIVCAPIDHRALAQTEAGAHA
jgi:hypothetical protein